MNKILTCQQKKPLKQKGVALMVSLLLLIGVTVLSISGMQSVTFNQRMVTNSNDIDHENHLAESAGHYAIRQTSWINSALNNLDMAPNNALSVVPNAENTHSISSLNTDNQKKPLTVDVGVLAKNIFESGFSAGESKQVSSWLVETHGSTIAENDRRTIVQGFQVRGAAQ